jgi:hypothetical protein
MPPPRLGERLVAEGLLSPSAINRALGFQKSAAPRVKLGSILLTWDLIDEASLLQALAKLHRCEAVTGEILAKAPVEIVRLLPAPHAVRLNAIAYGLTPSRIRVAFVNPSDLAAIDEVAALTGHACSPGVVTELRLLQAHRRFFGRAMPFELRPVTPRLEPLRPTRPQSFGLPSSGSAIAVDSGPPTRTAEAAPPISVPEIPIPPSPPPASAGALERPPEAAAAAAASAADAAPHWLPHSADRPTSELVLGMWSAAPPTTSDEEIGDLALACVPLEFPRAILFADRPGAFVGWTARGLRPGEISGLRVVDASPSVLRAVRESGAPHFGRVDEEMWPEALARRLDGPLPCAVFPVDAGHGVAAILYADRRGAPMRFEDTGLLARAAAQIAALLARESRAEGH